MLPNTTKVSAVALFVQFHGASDFGRLLAWRVGMNHQSYAINYRAAMESATAELDGLFEEAKRLRNRMEQIDSAINALKPLLGVEQSEFNSELNPTKQQIDSAFDLVLA